MGAGAGSASRRRGWGPSGTDPLRSHGGPVARQTWRTARPCGRAATPWACTLRECHQANPGKSFDAGRDICRDFKRRLEEGEDAQQDDRPWAPSTGRHSQRCAKIGPGELVFLKKVIDDEPRLYHDKISKRLADDHGIKLSPWNYARYMHLKSFAERLGYLKSWRGFFRNIHHTALVLDESHGNESGVRVGSGCASLLAVADCNGFVNEMCYVTPEPVKSDWFYDYFTIFVLPHLLPFGEKGGILVLDHGGRVMSHR